ncbi:nucleotide-sensitive chloride conductance regulator family protein [Perilla frutescens var. hirtella]|uniref:Nucleotide-sensitive chloride conductance regulator family protein n=1 Tax=Perilla frutescens var. hirtella TaxID=608512 RepID=A0AAD4J744_PERFH|nr:nucleotide-sensitive chloride conductance regulator family protein [Perilla frutescens var. frutescens]KAH6783057.1 nucleotide-sensitive chloride conductance regulator family protein [Perilla frutescens var. hirtella]KAH6828389.1 nucleotide-sensitive chloride conductance regulator family protein [Perilla frutescens var. hirtella]
MASGIRLVTERTGDGVGRPVLDADSGEELMLVQPGVSIVLGSSRRPPESPGTLYITTRQAVWLSDSDRAKGYAVDFISVSLHAVSRDPEAYTSPCIYAQIETGLEEDELEESDSESDDMPNLSKITEMRLVPSDPIQLDTLFAIFCECAELNPDPIEEEEVEHNWIFSADQLEDAAAEDDDSEWAAHQNPTHPIGANGNGNLDLAHSVVQLQINDRRFEDAEEMEQDSKNGHH